MVIYILYFVLLSILGFAIYQLSKKDERHNVLAQLQSQNELNLIADLRAANIVLWFCFVGGALLTATYAITFFSGSELINIDQWNWNNWAGAVVGLIVTISITSVQKVLYSSPNHSKAALVVTTAILIFVILSEVSTPMEREEMKMKEASQNSSVFKAVVGGIGNSTGAGVNYSEQVATATAEKSKHEFELKRCERHESKGAKRVQRCEDFENRAIAQAQAKIDSFRASADADSSSNESSRLTLINQAKALESNEEHHSAIIKFITGMFGSSATEAMMLASLILIVAFEAGFHFIGSHAGMLKAALSMMGSDYIMQKEKLKAMKQAKAFRAKAFNYDKDNKTGLNPDNNQAEGKERKKPFGDINGYNINMKENSGFNPVTAFNSKMGFRATAPATTTTHATTTAPIPIVVGVKTANESAEVIDKLKEGNRRASVGDTDAPRSSVKVFDALYDHLKVKLKEKVIKPTTRAMSKSGHEFVKGLKGVDSKKLSLLDVASDVRIITKKLLKEAVLIERSDYKRGMSKYKLNEGE